MAYQQSVALASLTATYTDSEAEDDVNDNNGKSSSSEGDKEFVSHTPPLSPPKFVSLISASSNNNVARLVSYNDDLVISEDEIEHQEGDPLKAVVDPLLAVENESDVQLPPEPTGRCSNELQEKIARLHEKMIVEGKDMNRTIQQRKDFRNPSIYEKLIQFCSINEFGTNYSPEIYDPYSWGKESYYEELDKVQRAEMNRREKERKEKTKVEFVVGTAKRAGGSGGGSNPGSGAEDDSKRRKSKWDQVGTNVVAPAVRVPAGILQGAALTTTATGTKGTVISAFGSLPKKPRV